MHFEDFVEPKNLVYLKRNIPIWINRADVIITASEYTKEEIVKHLKVEEKHVAVIPHGVDTNKFHHVDSTTCVKTLKMYGIDVNKFILHVGNIEPRKNITGLIEAYRNLPREISTKHPLLLIGGGGWLNEAENDAIASAIASGFKILKPNKYVADEDLPSFYSSASSLVMPSHYEGFGIPPLQAMACNTPTVVADNTSLREIFGETSILIDPNNLDSIKTGMLSSIEMTPQDLERYERNARAVVLSYSWSAAAKKLLRIIEKVGDM
jgi:alpha-1,3-rhamnosyl/mannosyltransferase